MSTSDVIVPEEKNSSSVSDIIEKPSLDVLAKTGFNYEDAITQIDEKYKDLQARIDEPGLFLAEPGDWHLQQERNQEINE